MGSCLCVCVRWGFLHFLATLNLRRASIRQGISVKFHAVPITNQHLRMRHGVCAPLNFRTEHFQCDSQIKIDTRVFRKRFEERRIRAQTSRTVGRKTRARTLRAAVVTAADVADAFPYTHEWAIASEFCVLWNGRNVLLMFHYSRRSFRHFDSATWIFWLCCECHTVRSDEI